MIQTGQNGMKNGTKNEVTENPEKGISEIREPKIMSKDIGRKGTSVVTMRGGKAQRSLKVNLPITGQECDNTTEYYTGGEYCIG